MPLKKTTIENEMKMKNILLINDRYRLTLLPVIHPQQHYTFFSSTTRSCHQFTASSVLNYIIKIK